MNNASPSTMSVLIVDDDRLIRKTLGLILESAGYNVTEASDGLAALDMLHESSSKSVVLLDWRMPRLDGLGVLQALAQEPNLALRHAYLILTVASEEVAPELLPTVPKLIVEVMAKPFDMDKLLETVADLAERLVVNDQLAFSASSDTGK